MSISFDINIHLDNSGQLEQNIRYIHELLCRNGIVLSECSTITAGDAWELGIEEEEPAVDIENIVNKLLSCQDFGSVEYYLDKGSILVSYNRGEGIDKFSCIQISVSDYSMKIIASMFDKVIECAWNIHKKLSAIRTIGAWGLDDEYYDEYESCETELDNLKIGKVVGVYWLDILRSDICQDERWICLTGLKKEESILENIDGNVYFQKEKFPY